MCKSVLLCAVFTWHMANWRKCKLQERILQPYGLYNRPHPPLAPHNRRISDRHCVPYKFIHLLTHLLKSPPHLKSVATLPREIYTLTILSGYLALVCSVMLRIVWPFRPIIAPMTSLGTSILDNHSTCSVTWPSTTISRSIITVCLCKLFSG